LTFGFLVAIRCGAPLTALMRLYVGISRQNASFRIFPKWTWLPNFPRIGGKSQIYQTNKHFAARLVNAPFRRAAAVLRNGSSPPLIAT
jgi:hypothetical protein